MASDDKEKKDVSEEEGEEEIDEKQKRRDVEYDPDGTLGIARGMSDKQARKKREALLEKSTSEEVQKHLWGTQAEKAQERRQALQKDDENPNYEKLTPKQKFSIEQRKKRGTDKSMNAKLERHETKRLQAAVAAADAADILQTDQPGMIEAENDMERTTALTQTQLKRSFLDNETARQIFDLDLAESAPYGMEYDRSGRYSILYGNKGHLALMDTHQSSLITEFYVHETVRDACFLHNQTLFAAAQKNHVFIYDNSGAEIHRLGEHNDPLALQFLPYHWLLASIGRAGWLKYQDTSTGELVSQHRTQLGACNVLRQNPSNAVLHAGHSNGMVTMWSPSSSKYLAKLLCHKGAAVTSLAIDPSGRTMVTGGADRQVKVWDLRMYKCLHSYYTAAGVPTSLDISQRSVLGVGHAGHATFWSPEALLSKVRDPYMHHALPRVGPVETLRFRPFEDSCGIGHSRGVSSIVIPGSGEPNLDTTEYNTNPFQDAKQRREAEVRALMDKLSPDMIALDADQVGGIEESDPHKRLERLQDLQEAANSKLIPAKKQKAKKRGRSKIQTKLRRKHRNVTDKNTVKLKEQREQEKANIQANKQGGQPTPEPPKESAPSALKRFF
jgi:U3 small nucleolar RNA-associated protein 7